MLTIKPLKPEAFTRGRNSRNTSTVEPSVSSRSCSGDGSGPAEMTRMSQSPIASGSQAIASTRCGK